MLKKINLFIVVSLGICFSLALVKEWKNELVGDLSANQSTSATQVFEDSEATDDSPWLFGASYDEHATPNTPKTHKWISVNVSIENNSAQAQDPKGILRLKMSKLVTQSGEYISMSPYESDMDWDKSLMQPGEEREVSFLVFTEKTTDAKQVRLITEHSSVELDL